jgi:hypothetical protein
LPVIDSIAADYRDDIVFLAVAGRADFEETAERAQGLFSDRLRWGLDDSIWDLYGIPYQPVTVLISGGDVIVDTWAGALEEDELRQRLDSFLSIVT